MKETDDSYPKKLEKIAKLKIVGEYTKASNHHILECCLCGDRFKATPKSKIANVKKYGEKFVGCPKCTQATKYKEIDENNTQRILDMGFEMLEDYKGYKEKILVRNTKCECGRSWKTTPEHILSGNSFCQPCNNEKKADQFRKYNEIRHELSQSNKEGFDQYQSKARLLTVQTYRKNKKEINPNNLRRGLAGDGDCYHLDHIVPIRYCYDHDIPVELCADKENLRLVPWKVNVKKHRKVTNNYPKIFWKYLKSYKTKLKILKKINKKLKLKGYENDFCSLDLYSSKKKLGLILHRFDDIVQRVTSYNHMAKINNLYAEKGIRVIHVYEDEWLYKTDIVIKKIHHIFGKSDVKKIYARKCEIKNIDAKTKNIFLENNHIQGGDKSEINLGAFYDDKLVSVMTFSSNNVYMGDGKTKEGVWNLSRFACDNDYHVIGIASKMLSHFKKNNDYSRIVSYADLRWSNVEDNMYCSLGFHRIGGDNITYYYIIDGIRKHRWNYRKSNLRKLFPKTFDSNLTEYENMNKNGYDRVWNCGIVKFVFDI
jgi:hypothetical protein